MFIYIVSFIRLLFCGIDIVVISIICINKVEKSYLENAVMNLLNNPILQCYSMVPVIQSIYSHESTKHEKQKQEKDSVG